jgi:SAM-dependent methyltransferase
MNPNITCILCGHTEAASDILSRQFRDEHSGRYTIARCAACGHAQVTPLPSLEEEAAYYAKDMQPRHLWKTGDYHEILRAKARPDEVRRLAWLSAVLRAGDRRILDIGSGYGFFVDAACRAGYTAIGLEVSDERLAFCRANMHGEFFQGEVDEAFVAKHAGRFDGVTAFHVIEHVRDPVIYVQRLLRLVKPGGSVLIEVPNVADEMIEQIPEYAAHHWQICHLSYFDKPRLDQLLRRAGAREFETAGVQRYGVRHLVSWTDRRAPDLSMPGAEGATPLMTSVEAEYRARRERLATCDTLVATVTVGPGGVPR